MVIASMRSGRSGRSASRAAGVVHEGPRPGARARPGGPQLGTHDGLPNTLEIFNP